MEPSAFHEHPFVRALGEEQVRTLQSCTRDARFAAGAFVFREGESADTFYLLRSGIVVLEQYVPGKGAVKVESLAAGDILGLTWLLGDGRWTLDARAIEPVHAYALDAQRVRACIRADAALGVELLTQMVQALYQRLMRVRLQRLDVYGAGG